MKDYKGNFRTYTTIKASDSGELPTEIQVLLPGDWTYNLKYPPFQVTAEHIRQMVANFKASVRKDVMIDVDHDGGKAAGWVVDLIDKAGEGLWAKVDWTVYGEDLLKNRLYKLMSPEFSLDYLDPENGQPYGAVFIAGSLVNRPLFKKLNAVVASEKGLTSTSGIMLVLSQETMTLEEIKTKNKEDLTPEEVTFLKEHSAELSDEEKTKFDLVEQPKEDPKIEEPKSEDPKPEEPKVEEPKVEDPKPEPEVKGSESETVTIKASEYAEFMKAKAALIAKEASETIQAFVCNEKGGVIMDKDKDAFTSFYLKCSDEQKVEFKKLLALIPKKVIIAGEIGEGQGASSKNPLEQVEELIAQKMKANEKVDYATALSSVRTENPDLWKEYSEFKASEEFKKSNKVKKDK